MLTPALSTGVAMGACMALTERAGVRGDLDRRADAAAVRSVGLLAVRRSRRAQGTGRTLTFGSAQAGVILVEIVAVEAHRRHGRDVAAGDHQPRDRRQR